ncbi:MAG TPA: hypothetical protein VEH27_15175 [Methylomirabilota bacterium]|nr:hypothetical protein [Methylomirabilota bacterium]
MRALTTSPTATINASLYLSLTGMHIEAVQEGLERGAWSEADLGALLAALPELKPFELMANALREGELAGVGHMIAEHNRPAPKQKFSMDRLGKRIQPRRWIYQNRIAHASTLKPFIDSMNRTNLTLDLRAHQSGLASLTNLLSRMGVGTMLAAMVLPDLKQLGPRAAQSQALVNHAVIACALELHRKRTGRYPESLDALGVKLPHDVITGGPVHYKRTEDGFLLYSVGMNQVDDHGSPTLDWAWKR